MPACNASTRTEDHSPHTPQTAPAGMFALGLGARDTAQGEGRKRVTERWAKAEEGMVIK